MPPTLSASRTITWMIVVSLVLAPAAPAAAYQTYGVRVSGRVAVLKWEGFPVRYSVTDRGAPGVSAEAFRDAAGRAFATWRKVSSAAVSAEFGGFTSAEAGDDDGVTTLGFRSRPDLDRVLGATDFVIDVTTGRIVESDIFFNSEFAWSVAAGGESGRYDLESIILHETGHLFGLGHSALGETELRAGGGRRVIAAEAVMFPIAYSAGNVSGRTPRADDVAGISDLYPAAGFLDATGSLVGRVTLGGKGVVGAHVVAFNPRTGRLVGNFTVNAAGEFQIASLEPGPYIVRVEPIDDADLDSYFSEAVIGQIDLGFRVTYARQLVVVPAGGSSLSADIEVDPK